MLLNLKLYLLAIALTASITQCLIHNTIPQTNAVQKIASVIHAGPSALNLSYVHHVPDTTTNSDPDHTTYKLGDTSFYSFTFSLQEEWQFSLRTAFYLAQFTADFTDQTCQADRPSGLVYVVGNQLHARVVTGTPCEPVVTFFDDLGAVQVEEWHSVSIMVKWAADETGFYHLWLDGVKVLEKEGIKTMMDDPRVFEFGLCGGLRCIWW